MNEKNERLFSLDLLRGLDMFLLCCVHALAAYVVSHVFRKSLADAAECLSAGFDQFMPHAWRMFLQSIVYILILTFTLVLWRAYKRRSR